MEKRGRILDAAEAQNVLETTATRKTLVSWFAPFWSQMADAIDSRKSTVILNGRTFNVRQTEDKRDYVFGVPTGFVPMIRISRDRLNELIPNADS